MLAAGALPAARAGPRPRALPLHQRLKARLVDTEVMLGDDLQGHVDRESVGVVQQEGVGAGDALGAGVAGALDQLVEPAQTQFQRAAEAVLLGGQPAVHELALRGELGVATAHQLDHPVGVAGQKARLKADLAAVLDGAADDAPQDVAAVLVGGDDAIGDQEGGRAGVIGQDPQRLVDRVLVAVAPSGELLAERDQGRELVGLKDGLLRPAGSSPSGSDPGPCRYCGPAAG